MDFNRIFSWIREMFSGGAFDFLQDVDEETLSPVAAILNINAKTLCSLIKVLPPLFKGEISFKEALPYLLPIFLSFLLSSRLRGSDSAVNSSEAIEKPTYSPTFEQNNTANELNSFADNDIYYSLNAYLQSDSAS